MSDSEATPWIIWKNTLFRLHDYYYRKKPKIRFFKIKLFLFFLVLNITCYWWGLFTAFPEYTHGEAGRHYFKTQFLVGIMGALFDFGSFFITLKIIKLALRVKNFYGYIGLLSIDAVIAVVATFWVLFVFIFSGWVIGFIEVKKNNTAILTEDEYSRTLEGRKKTYQKRVHNALRRPTREIKNIYFGLIMGVSASLPTVSHFSLFLLSLFSWLRRKRSYT